MRLSEIESSLETEKQGALVTLLTMLKTKANSKNTGLTVSFNDLNRLMGNLGFSITSSELDQLVKSSDSINNLVHTYDNTSVTIATDNVDDSSKEFDPGNQDTVKQMAKRATNKRD